MNDRQSWSFGRVACPEKSLSRGVLVALVCWVVGCVPQPVTIKTAPEFVPARIQSVAVLPFEALATPQSAYQGSQVLPPPDAGATEYISSFELAPTSVPGPQSGKYVAIPPGVPSMITKMVFEKLEKKPGLRVIPMAKTQEALIRVKSSGQAEDRIALARLVGRALSVDAVLTGLVRVYREREGSRLGATPAAVGFEAQLVETKTGDVVWVGDFYEEQKPLSEDVRGFFEHGWGFVTAKEIAQLGVKKMINRLPLGNSSAS